MEEEDRGEPGTSREDYEKRISVLEEELVRKDKQLEELKMQNKILFQTALKNSEVKVDTRLKKTYNTKQ